MLDLVLEGAEVHDGSGAEARVGSVGVAGGRIVDRSVPSGAAARRRLDVRGLAVAPGFIDPHSHADLILVQESARARRLLQGRVAQGITTALVGNCGMGAAPVPEGGEDLLRSLNAWMTPEDVPWPWRDLPGYLDELERRPLPLNVGALQAHGPLRLEALGAGPGAAGAEARRAMRRRARAALEAGAFGISAGLIYPPGMYSDTGELADVAREAGRLDRPFTCHLRGSSELLLPAVDELLAIGERSGAPVHHSHSEAVGREHWGKIDDVLRREAQARSRGVRVSHDLFPYHAAATLMAALLPPWSLDGGIGSLLERLRQPGTREEIRREVEGHVPAWPPWAPGGWPHNLVRAVGWDSIRVASVPEGSGEETVGRTLADLARRRGRRPFDLLADLLLEHRGEVGQLLFGVTGEEGDEAPMGRLISDPHGAFCTDAEDIGRGLPHPAAFGAFPHVLGHWVRERRALTLPEAIRRMTSLPAEIFGIAGRGRIVPGAHADLVVFDPETIAGRSGYDEPRRPPAGIHHVLVNGVAVVEDGLYADRPAGRVLRR